MYISIVTLLAALMLASCTAHVTPRPGWEVAEPHSSDLQCLARPFQELNNCSDSSALVIGCRGYCGWTTRLQFSSSAWVAGSNSFSMKSNIMGVTSKAKVALFS
jgi:hypothetical protein